MSLSTLRSIAFVACNKNADSYRFDPSFIYRCENLGLALTNMGYMVHSCHVKTYGTAQRHDIVIFHRPKASLRLRLMLRSLRRKGAIVIADFDDLVFDESYTTTSPGFLNNLVSARTTQRLYQSHQEALSWFDSISVSTEPLADHVMRLFPSKNTQVIHNCVHRSWQRGHRFSNSHSKEKVITYFPGTRSHDRDFAMMQEPLSMFLRDHPEIQLQVTGKLAFKIDAGPGQIRHEEKVPFAEYKKRVQSGWVNIAPLEDTSFNQCKSALKIMEAGYFEIPTICSPNTDNQRFVGAGALVANTPEAWLTYLKDMLDESKYQQTSTRLHDRSSEIANIDAEAEVFLQFALRQKNRDV